MVGALGILDGPVVRERFAVSFRLGLKARDPLGGFGSGFRHRSEIRQPSDHELNLGLARLVHQTAAPAAHDQPWLQ
jgi:hypothetical protein